MLNKTDIEFIIGTIDKATYQGLAANHKCVEVFLKLQEMSKQIDVPKVSEDVEADAEKEVVPE